MPLSDEIIFLTPAKKSLGLSICAKTLLAVIIVTLPYFSLISEATTGLKKSIIVSMPFLIASSAMALLAQHPKLDIQIF